MRWWEDVLKKDFNVTVVAMTTLFIINAGPYSTNAALLSPPQTLGMPSMPVAPKMASPMVKTPMASAPSSQGNTAPQLQPMPAPAQTTQPPMNHLSDEEAGVQGNWVKKKEWLTRADALINNEITAIDSDIQSIRTSFSDKYNQIDKELDTYYKEMGLSQGILNELFTSIEKYLEKKKAEEIKSMDEAPEDERLSERERAVQAGIIDEKMADNKTKLKQLKLDMKSIEDLDKSLHDRLKKMNDQIVQVLDLEKQSQQLLDTIWDIIDHNKAQALYYKLKNDVVEKLKSLQTYLKTSLSPDFDNVINSIRQQIGKTKEEIQRVEQDGLVIKDRAARLTQLKREKLERIRAAQLAAEQQAAQSKRRRKKQVQTSWYSHIINWTASAINIIKSPFSWFFGSSKPVIKKQTVPSTQAQSQQPASTKPQDAQTMPVNSMPVQQPLMPLSPAPGIAPMPMEHEG